MKVDVILDARADAHELAELGRLAERFDLDGVWVSSLPDGRDPWANLSLLADRSRRVCLGPIAVNPFDTHPVRIAAGLLSLNELAGGRARIVLGGGGEALQALGISPARRVRAVREAVEILRGVASGARLDYAGELYQVSGVRLGWVTAPPPPIHVGASQAQMLRMAAQVADGIMMSDLPPPACAAALDMLGQALATQGRSRAGFPTSAFVAWHVQPDPLAARREARRWLLLRGIFRPWLLADFLDPADVALVMDSRAAFARAFAAGSDEVEGVPPALLDALVDNITVCGSSAQLDPVIGHLCELRDAGLDGIALRLYARPAESIRLIGREILPALRGG